MTRRMLDTSIWANEHFADLPPMGRLLLIGIITLADDQGRCKANPAYLRSQVFPYDDLDTDDIAAWLGQLADNETVILYSANGKAYLQMCNWWAYQPLDWARPSDHPAPDGWQDRIRYNAKGGTHLTYNWTTKAGSPMPDTCDSKGQPLGMATRIGTPPPTKVGTPPTNADRIEVDIDQNRSNLEEDSVRVAIARPTLAPDKSSAASPAWQAYTENMPGTITPVIADQVNALIDDYGDRDVYRAIVIACERNKRSLGYVKGVLERGIDTPKPAGNGRPSKNLNAMIATTELVQEYRGAK